MKRSPLRKVSSKRAQQLRHYGKIRAALLAKHFKCQVCGRNRSEDIHHMNGRSGARLTDTTWLLAVCRPCHDWIHRNPGKAREARLLI